MSPDGNHLYVAGGVDDAVAVFSRNASSRALTFLEVHKDGIGGVDGLDGAVSLRVSPDGKHLYAAGTEDNALAVFSVASPTPTPTAICDLGTLGGSFTFARDINDLGQVVGVSETALGEFHAFLWVDSVMSDLGTLGGDFSFARGINNLGQVVGSSDTASGELHAFLWFEGTMIDLGSLGGAVSFAEAINDLGQVVGVSETGSGEGHAFLWDGGTMTDLATLGSTFSFAEDINDLGQVVGDSETGSGEGHAFLWFEGTMTDLGTLGGAFSFAGGINSLGQVVGGSETSPDGLHAFLWFEGTMGDLGTLGGTFSFATDINSLGQVVGGSETALGQPHAFLWEGGVMSDLETIGSTYKFATGINNLGQIVGESTFVRELALLPIPPTLADLAISRSSTPDPAIVGSNLSYTITVTNQGPGTAFDVKLEDSLSGGVTFVYASAGYTENDGTVICDLGELVSGATSSAVTIVVIPTVAGTIPNVASTFGFNFDLDPSNNISLETTTVNNPVADFVVNSTADPGNGVCDPTECTLREAIGAANAHPGRDIIAFNIPGAGPHKIKPASALLVITDPVAIDGYTQPGASPNTNPSSLGSNATLKIELDGTIAGASSIGVHIVSGGSKVRGLVVNRFGGAGIRLAGPGGNAIEGNFIGTDVAGKVARGNGKGVVIRATSDNTIGGSTPAARNVISGNGNSGININGPGATGNVVQGNLIGTDITGTLDLGNTNDGIRIDGPAYNAIGGTAPGSRNVISGNDNSGIRIGGSTATSTLVQGNFIGTQVDGTSPLGNLGAGVWILASASDNAIEGTASSTANTIAFNGGGGVLVNSGTGNIILTNSILSNTGLGIDLSPLGVTANDLGDGDTGANNLQNFPELTLATTGVGGTDIEGPLNSAPNTNFRLEFFSNSTCDTSGHGEGAKFLGSIIVLTDGSGYASFNASFATVVPVGQLITATATDPAHNTSEFSACRTVS